MRRTFSSLKYRNYRRFFAGQAVSQVGSWMQRFALGWRIGHLCFALVTMTLVLTGMTALYSETGWARVVAKAFGGANNLGIVHRVCAALFVSIFVVQ